MGTRCLPENVPDLPGQWVAREFGVRGSYTHVHEVADTSSCRRTMLKIRFFAHINSSG